MEKYIGEDLAESFNKAVSETPVRPPKKLPPPKPKPKPDIDQTAVPKKKMGPTIPSTPQDTAQPAGK